MTEREFVNKAEVGDTAQIPAEYLKDLLRIKKAYEVETGIKSLPVVCELLSRTNDTGLGHYLTPSEFLSKKLLSKDVIVEVSELTELLKDHRKLYEEVQALRDTSRTLQQEVRGLHAEMKFKNSLLASYEVTERQRNAAKRDEALIALDTKAASEVHVSGISGYLDKLHNGPIIGSNLDQRH